MKNAKVKEAEIWADILQNPKEHRKALEFVFISGICFLGIVIIRMLV